MPHRTLAARLRSPCAAVDAMSAAPMPDFDDDAIEALADAEQRIDFKTGDHVELGGALLEQVDDAGPHAVFDLGELHKYDAASGLWRMVDRALQSRIVQSFSGCTRATEDGPKPLKIKLTDVVGAMRLAADQAAQTDFFHLAPSGIAFSDAFVRVTHDAIIVQPHAPENRARLGYPFAYDTSAPRLWLAFLEAIFRDDADKQERIAFVNEFFGACLLGIAPRFNKCAIFVGQGGEGKGSLLKIAIAAMPAGSTSAIPPHQIGGEYYRAQLAGKLLNAASELPEADILDSTIFKAVVGGDPIVGRTIRESPFTFCSKAGHAFSANRLPGTTDTTSAFWDRFIVLPFTRRMRGSSDDDVNIVEKILAKELPAIVGAFVQAGARMLKANGYTLPASHHAALAAWRKNADQVAMFAAERLVTATDALPSAVDPHDWSGAQTLYDAYRQWAADNGHRSPLSSNNFSARLVALGVTKKQNKRGTFYSVRFKADRPSDWLEEGGSRCN
jgi:P4 family phage/plasmid primase-like protien